MTKRDNFVFRRGREGDRSTPGSDESVPTFVLYYNEEQVVSGQGGKCFINLVHAFREGEGHGTKFFELWEEYARANGCKEIQVCSVASSALEHILRDKMKFTESQDEGGEKEYTKKLLTT